jgi:hypothetical protein
MSIIKVTMNNSKVPSTGSDRLDEAADRILEILEERFHYDRKSARHLLFEP